MKPRPRERERETSGVRWEICYGKRLKAAIIEVSNDMKQKKTCKYSANSIQFSVRPMLIAVCVLLLLLRYRAVISYGDSHHSTRANKLLLLARVLYKYSFTVFGGECYVRVPECFVSVDELWAFSPYY